MNKSSQSGSRVERFARIAEHHQERAAAIRQIQEILAKIPDLEEELFGQADGGTPKGDPASDQGDDGRTRQEDNGKSNARASVISFFLGNGNLYAAKSAIVADLKSNNHTIGYVLTDGFKRGDFEKSSTDTSPNLKWRMSQAAFDKAKAKQKEQKAEKAD